MVDGIKKKIGKPGVRQPYPYPTEQEAYQYISDSIFSMGEAPHRTKVKNYFMVRKMQDEGMTIQQISESTGMSSTKVCRIQHTPMNKLLNKDQRLCIRHAHALALEISKGCITPKSLAIKLNGKLESRLVHRCVRELVKKYKKLRSEIREQNSRKENKGLKVKKSTIWNYIRTGKTESEKLARLNRTHPEMEHTIMLCTTFINTLFNREGALELEEWIRRAEKAAFKEMRSFVKYIKLDIAAVKMACVTNYSNGMMEGTVNKIKVIKRTMFNRASIELLRAKAIYADYGNGLT
jgi:hypothetical protein